jgi:membrane associated rhomboid family serine protease
MPAAIGLLLSLVLIATVGSWIARDLDWAALSPLLLRQGQLWRLVSWVIVEPQPINLLFGGFMLYQFGGQLVFDWGEARFLFTSLLLVLAAALATVLMALAWPPFWGFAHVGLWPLVDALLLMWALRYPDQQMSFWGVLPMTGRTMALLVVCGTVLYGLAAGGLGGLRLFTPHFGALVAGWALSRSRVGFPLRRWKLAWRDFRMEQQLRRRSKHLKVVGKGGRDEPPRWMN